jgi:DNA-binding winged helix-turn-helix (wHTH) protein
LFGILAYIFDNKKEILKGNDLIEKVWGIA